MAGYRDLFSRNYGIFTEARQENIRCTRVLIIGDSGSGETIALELLRSGFEAITMAGADSYTLQDINRQPCCFTDTIGRKKTDVIKESLLSINPWADISIIPFLPDENSIDETIAAHDIIIPAVDDLAYSVLIFRAARKLKKPSVLCMPTGSMGWVSVIDETTPSIEDVFGIPELSYEGLRRVMHTRAYRCAQYNFITSGDWRVGWFWEYFLGRRPLALICPVSWLAASLAALEALKLASGRWDAVRAPKCWYISKGKVRISRFSLFIRYHRMLGWKIFGNRKGQRFHRQAYWFWRKFFAYLKNTREVQP